MARIRMTKFDGGVWLLVCGSVLMVYTVKRGELVKISGVSNCP